MQSSPHTKRLAPGQTRFAAQLLRAALALALTLGVASSAASPSETTPSGATAGQDNQRKAQSIARQTMSPFCPGRTLADCPSEHAAAWRRDIQTMLDQGRTAQEIQREFEQRAGGDLSGSPNRAAGYGLSIGLAAASLAVLFGLLHLLRSRKRTTDDEGVSSSGTAKEPAEGPTADPKLDERLDRELAAELDDEED